MISIEQPKSNGENKVSKFASKINNLNLFFQTPDIYDFLHKFSGYSKRQSPRYGDFAVCF